MHIKVNSTHFDLKVTIATRSRASYNGCFLVIAQNKFREILIVPRIDKRGTLSRLKSCPMVLAR